MATRERPYSPEWAAVSADSLEAPADGARIGRIWLVARPDARLGIHHIPDLTIRAEPDLAVHAVWDPHRLTDIVSVAVPAGTMPLAQDQVALDRAVRETRSNASVSWAWSVPLTSKLVANWIEEQTGRSDVRVTFQATTEADTGLPPESVLVQGFTTMHDFISVVRVGRGDVEVGLAAMPTRDRAATADKLLAEKAKVEDLL